MTWQSLRVKLVLLLGSRIMHVFFFLIWLGDTAGKLWKLNKPETLIRSHRKTRAPRAEHLFKTRVFDWCWKIAKECIGQTGSQSSRLRKVLSAFCPSRKDATNSYLPHPGKWWMQVSFPECVPLVTKSKTQKFLQIKVTWYVRSFLSLRQNGWESNLKMEDSFWFMTSVVSVHCHWLRCSWVTVRSNITIWECGGAEQLTPLRPGSTKRDRESKKGW